MSRKMLLLALAAAACVVMASSVAWAFFASGGGGSGSATVGSLAAPTAVSATASGASVAVTWTDAAAPPTGAVGFYVTRLPAPTGTEVVVCGTAGAPLAAPADSCTDSPIGAGTYTYSVTAVAATFSATSMPSPSVTVASPTTTTTLSQTSGAATYGAEEEVTWTATVSTSGGGAPSGTVAVASDGTTLCDITLPATTCTSPPTALPASATARSVVATYGGDAGHSGSASLPRTVTIGQDTTATAVVASLTTVTVGFEDASILTVTVATANGEPLSGAEAVTILAGTSSCPATVTPSTGGGSGSCHLVGSALAVSGTRYPVSAAFGGDADCTGSTATAATGLRVVTTPSVTTASLPTATQGQTGYSKRLTVAGGTTPFTWSIGAGSLPTGLSLATSTGTVHGNVDPAAVSTTVTLIALDASGAAASATWSLTVVAPPHITTSTLAPAWAGEAGYVQAVAVTGGAPPLAWSSSGILPDGLALDSRTGVISGSPLLSATTETFAITATDANGVADVRTYTLTVTPVFVQQRTLPAQQESDSSYSVVLAAPVAAGDTLVLSIGQPCADDSGPVDSAVADASWDGQGFAPAAATGCTDSGDAEIWDLVGTGAASGTAATTVTVDLAAPAYISFLNVTEYTSVTGTDASSAAAASASGSGSDVSAGPVTPSGPDELVVSTASVDTPTSGSLAQQLAPSVLLNQSAPFQGFALFGIDQDASPSSWTYVQTAPDLWAAASCAFALGH